MVAIFKPVTVEAFEVKYFVAICRYQAIEMLKKIVVKLLLLPSLVSLNKVL